MTMQLDGTLTRAQIRAMVSCPKCRAGKGEPCQDKKGPRTASHFSRLRAAQKMQNLKRLEQSKSEDTWLAIDLDDDPKGWDFDAIQLKANEHFDRNPNRRM